MPAGFGMNGMPGGRAQTFHFSTNGGNGGFSFSNPNSIFSEFFKQGGAAMGDDDDIFAQFGGGPRMSGGRGSQSGMDGNRQQQQQQHQFQQQHQYQQQRPTTPDVTTVERPLNVTLEELFNGVHKKMKIKRKTFDNGTNKRRLEDKILEMDIRPGYKAGTKIKFKGVGDQEEGGTQDLHFIITEVRMIQYSSAFPSIVIANVIVERTSHIQTRRRQYPSHCRNRPQRSPHGMEPNHPNDRWQASGSLRCWPDSSRL